jgi:predicted phosphohydrolase
MSKIRVIGDVHGKIPQYLKTITDSEFSLQLGDFAFDYRFLGNIDDTKHVFFPGNHDNYDKCFAYPHCIGDYGYENLNGIDFYFVRGGFSIDKEYRERHYAFTGQKSWWSNEELSQKDMYACLNHYSSIKPELVITHECPRSISNQIGNPDILLNFGFDPDTFTTNTSELLEAMYRQHQPKLWIFGHYHRRKEIQEEYTKFICLPELGYCDIDKNLRVS